MKKIKALSIGCQKHQESTLMVGKTVEYGFRFWVLTIGFCVEQILGITRFQIWICKKKKLVWIFTSLKRCCIQLEKLDKMILSTKIDPISCKYLSNLVELIEINVDIEKELQKFEGAFEKMKLWSSNFWI